MEPSGPSSIARCTGSGARICRVTAETKAALARIMVVDLTTNEGLSPLMTCLERLATSLAKA